MSAGSQIGRRPTLAILGTRGIPARHGGFETFAERLSLYLVERGWDVEVYCQSDGEADEPADYLGVRLRHVRTRIPGALGTLVFDWHALRQACTSPPRLLLTLGYNTGSFAVYSRLRRRVGVINMDGIEWRRSKWPAPARAWFWANEWMACHLHDHLIADHPAIADHLATRVARRHITTIPYGADRVEHGDALALSHFNLTPRSYALVVARPEPENSILEIVRAFSRRRRGLRLLVLGNVSATGTAYQREVLRAAGPEAMFPGAIYDAEIVAALRFHCAFYVHGHQVGGTNPSLVEALGAGSAVLAHDNPFNRWVAGPDAAYFAGEDGCAQQIDALIGAPTQRLDGMREASRTRHREAFTWPAVLARYEELLLHWWQFV